MGNEAIPRETVQIHLGEGATLDGGPFFNCEVTDVEHTGDVSRVVIEDQNGVGDKWELNEIEDALTDELESGEPINVSGIHPKQEEEEGKAVAGAIELPIVDGMDVEAGGYLMTAEAVRLENIPDDWLIAVETADVSYFPA